MTDPRTDRLTLPTLSLDYKAGRFLNTMTGESATELSGVVLAYRTERVLWPSLHELPRLPLCVNGSVYGPCPCPFADWGKDGTPPDCDEELSLLLWEDGNAQVVVVTARKSQSKTLERYLDMKALLGGLLHDQRVTVRMTPGTGEDQLHRLTLLPGELLLSPEVERLAGVAKRVQAAGGGWEGV